METCFPSLFCHLSIAKTGCVSKIAVLKFTCTVVTKCVFYGSENVAFYLVRITVPNTV